MTPECLITGCRLYIPDEGKSLWGDLWLLGVDPLSQTYIFNGVLHNGQASWSYDDQDGTPVAAVSAPSLNVLSTRAYFERRGVVVVSGIDVELNPTAAGKLRAHLLRVRGRFHPS